MDALDPTEMDTFAQEKGRRGQGGPFGAAGGIPPPEGRAAHTGRHRQEKSLGRARGRNWSKEGGGRDPQLELLRGSQCCLFGSRSMMLS